MIAISYGHALLHGRIQQNTLIIEYEKHHVFDAVFRCILTGAGRNCRCIRLAQINIYHAFGNISARSIQPYIVLARISSWHEVQTRLIKNRSNIFFMMYVVLLLFVITMRTHILQGTGGLDGY